MPRYAVNLGKVRLVSDTPITVEERAEAIKLVRDAARETLGEVVDGLTVEFVPDPS